MPSTVNSLDVIEFILGTKTFAILYDGVSIAGRIGLKGGHLCTTSLIFLCCSTLRAPDDLKDSKYSLIRFSWFTVKFIKPFLVSNF